MKKKHTPSTHEEFALEFGDVNGTKLYEFPFASKKNQKKTSTIIKK